MRRRQGEEDSPEDPGRRRFLRLAGGAFLLALVPGLAQSDRAASQEIGPKAEITGKCTGCTGCVPVCPSSAIRVTTNKVSIDDDRCEGCGVCIPTCPVAAIRMPS